MVFVLPKVESFGEQMGRSLGEGLGQAGQSMAAGLLSRHQRKKEANYFSELAKKHPNDRSYELLAELSSSPLSEERQSTMVKALLGRGQNQFLQKQQDRLDRDSMAKLYNTKIREIDDELKYGLGSDKDALRAKKETLQAERDSLFEALKEQQHDFSDVDNISDTSDTEEDNALGEEDYPRVTFDFKNKKHIAARDKALKMAKGDRAKAEKILRKRFKL